MVVILLNAEIITLRAIALKRFLVPFYVDEVLRRDHNATSYSTETAVSCRLWPRSVGRRDHNATSYSTETLLSQVRVANSFVAEIITLRAIALKLSSTDRPTALKPRRDHNATSYSTETFEWFASKQRTFSRDHNATSYSTETA